jgi:SulP family sulfate permease
LDFWISGMMFETYPNTMVMSKREDGIAKRAWSLHEASPLLSIPLASDASNPTSSPVTKRAHTSSSGRYSSLVFVYYIVYALVNVIISVPGLYGYAAVIFNHPVFSSNMNALSKLVIFSSAVMQLSFICFSTMSFAIGTVQDAGLIFLSSMANTIANEMLEDGESEKAILSTTMVLLSGGTALLGVVLIAIGKFKLTNVVSYLPMPVIGGYLAFIGYFCVQGNCKIVSLVQVAL